MSKKVNLKELPVGASKVSKKDAWKFPTAKEERAKADAKIAADLKWVSESTIPESITESFQFHPAIKAFVDLPLLSVFVIEDGDKINTRNHKIYHLKVGNSTAIKADELSSFSGFPILRPADIIFNMGSYEKVRIKKSTQTSHVYKISKKIT